MCAIRVVIDTSVLRSESLASGPMEALARFAEQGHIQILIPYVVAEEYRTKPSSKIESLAQLREVLKRLRTALPSEVHRVISEFESRITGEFDSLEASARHRFDKWRHRTEAAIVDPAPNQASKVLEKYFAGKPPFKSVKARQDIPDAFI